MLLLACEFDARDGDRDGRSGWTSLTSGPTIGCPHGFDTSPPVVQRASVGCELDRQVTFGVDTTGWAYPPNTVYAIATGDDAPWDENHPVPSVWYHPCAEASSLELSIPTRDPAAPRGPGDYVPGASSAFTCEDHYEAGTAVMTYAFAVTDEDGDRSDCLAFGHDPAGLVLGF